MSAEKPSSLWVMWRLVRHRPGLFLGHLTYVTAAAYVLPFLPPLVVGALLDGLSGARAVAFDTTTLLLLFLAIGVVRSAGDLAGPVVAATMRVHGQVLMRRNLFHRVLHRPGARALPSSPGEALVRFQHDPEAVTEALDFVADPIGQVIGLALAFTVLARIDAFLTLVVVVPALLVMLGARLATPYILDARRRRQDAHGSVTGLLGDAFSSIASVQAATAEDRVTRRLDDLNETRRRTALRDVLVDQVVTSVATNTASVATGVLLLLAAARARTGAVSAGDFIVFSSYLGSLSIVISFVGHMITTLRQADVSVERMAEVLQGLPAHEVVAHHPIHLRGPFPAVPPVARRVPLEEVAVAGLTFRYPGSGRGVEGADLSVRRGEVVAVTGRVGSGKTTLVRALLGLLPASAGEVRWNGIALTEPGSFLVPPQCAYTPQVPRLFSASLRDNVVLGLEPRPGDEALDAAAAAAVLESDLAAVDDGWETLVGPRGVRLSGGQVQRVAAARMFVRDAELLVLDDLSSALDVETEEELWRRLFARPVLTCIVVTHRRPVLARADRVYAMRDGRLRLVTSSRRS